MTPAFRVRKNKIVNVKHFILEKNMQISVIINHYFMAMGFVVLRCLHTYRYCALYLQSRTFKMNGVCF